MTLVIFLLGAASCGVETDIEARSETSVEPSAVTIAPPRANIACDDDPDELAILGDELALPAHADGLTAGAAAVALTSGCVARGTLAGRPTWLFFTRTEQPCKPAATAHTDRNAVDELARLIRSVPRGGRIDGHIFSITDVGVASALLEAQTKGVAVWLSTNGAVGCAQTKAKTDYLDKLTHKVYCQNANNDACISTAPNAISHTKLFVFSTATAPDGVVANHVVWLGSANQTTLSGMQRYNNTVTIYDAETLYNKLRPYLDDLFNQRRRADYYDPASGRGHILAGAADVYASPEAQTDLVVNRLDDITPDASCNVRVMQAAVRDSRLVVVNKLVSMKDRGCQVSVVASTVEPQAAAKFRTAGIPVHHMPIHDKSFIVFAKFGAGYQYRVYTGSHNLGSSAAHNYDEIFVKLAAETGTTHPIFDAYVRHFNDAFGATTN